MFEGRKNRSFHESDTYTVQTSRAILSAGIVSAVTLLIAPPIEAQRFQDNDGGVQQREGRRGPGGRQRDPAERLEERVNRLTQELRLSPRQANRVRAIFEEARQRMEGLRDGVPQDREARQQLDEQRQAETRVERFGGARRSTASGVKARSAGRVAAFAATAPLREAVS